MDTKHSLYCGAERCVTDFIQQIWNERQFEQIDHYLHEQFVDYSMPYYGFQNKNGTMLYLRELAKRVHHQTQILKLTNLNEFILCQVRICVMGINESSHYESFEIEGCRLFQISDEKIIAHWEII